MTTTQIHRRLLSAGAPAYLTITQARLIARAMGARTPIEWQIVRLEATRLGRWDVARAIADSLAEN
jgi:hypothetical protein